MHSLAGRHPGTKRTGAATLWLVLVLPVFVIFLCVVVEVGNIWLARIELSNALEAAALAGVKEWGDASLGGPTNPADTEDSRTTAVNFAAANTVLGEPVVIDDNYRAAARNGNDTCIVAVTPPAGNLIFGTVREDPPVFRASEEPDCTSAPERQFAVRAQASVKAPGICEKVLGDTIGPFYVTAHATAVYDCSTGRASLVHIDPANYNCP